eukprot:c47801_g1_i1 orf=124-843(+)
MEANAAQLALDGTVNHTSSSPAVAELVASGDPLLKDCREKLVNTSCGSTPDGNIGPCVQGLDNVSVAENAVDLITPASKKNLNVAVVANTCVCSETLSQNCTIPVLRNMITDDQLTKEEDVPEKDIEKNNLSIPKRNTELGFISNELLLSAHVEGGAPSSAGPSIFSDCKEKPGQYCDTGYNGRVVEVWPYGSAKKEIGDDSLETLEKFQCNHRNGANRYCGESQVPEDKLDTGTGTVG